MAPRPPSRLHDLRAAIEANSQIAQALFKKAKAGDTTAAIFWLKCRVEPLGNLIKRVQKEVISANDAGSR
jgi:hypothetical protein